MKGFYKKGDEEMANKYNREQIALDLLLCSSNVEVCRRNNISEATLYRLKKEDDFIEILNNHKARLFNNTINKAQAYSLEALEILMDIARDTEAPQNTRVNASCKIIEFGQSMYDQENIIKRLEEIERGIKENEED